jgi:hypothetical protein
MLVIQWYESTILLLLLPPPNNPENARRIWAEGEDEKGRRPRTRVSQAYTADSGKSASQRVAFSLSSAVWSRRRKKERNRRGKYMKFCG